MAVTTQDDVGRLLQVTFGTPDDPRVGQLIAAAQAAVENAVGQPFDRTAGLVWRTNGRGWSQITLPRWPIHAVESVVELGVTLTVTDDYEWYGNGQLWRVAPAGWAFGAGAVVVTYEAGWADETEAPDDIRWLVAGVAARLWQAGVAFAENQGASGVVQETIGGYSVTYGEFAKDTAGAVQLTEDEMERAKRLRRSRVGSVSL